MRDRLRWLGCVSRIEETGLWVVVKNMYNMYVEGKKKTVKPVVWDQREYHENNWSMWIECEISRYMKGENNGDWFQLVERESEQIK